MMMAANQEAAQELIRQMHELHGSAEHSNPAGSDVEPRRRRIPMSIPRQRLQVPEIPGYYLYWFREENVPRAIDAGYVFVGRDEINVNPTSVASDNDETGNTDLGTRVSLITGITAGGQPMRAYLMKLRQEWRDEDVGELNKANMRIMEAIFGDEASQRINEQGQITEMDGTSYRGKALFNRPTRKAAIGKRAR